MLQKNQLLLTLFLFAGLFTYSQSISHKKDYTTGETMEAIKSGDNYSLKFKGTQFANDKIKTDSKVQEFIFNKCKAELLKTHAAEQVKVVSFCEKFSKTAVENFFKSDEENVVLDKLVIDKQYEVHKIWSARKGYTFYLHDNDEDGKDPVVILSKIASGYIYDVQQIKSDVSLQSVILTAFPEVVSFIKKENDLKVPTVTVQVSKGKCKLLFSSAAPNNEIAISDVEADKLKGKLLSDDKKDPVNYALKNDSPATAETKEETGATDTKEVKKSSVDLVLSGKSYTLELWHKKEGYFLKLCGLTVKMVDDGKGGKTPQAATERSCTASTETFTKLEDNKDNFMTVVNNLAVKVNEQINTTDKEYLKEMDKAYDKFKDDKKEEEVKKQFEERDNRIAEILNEPATSEEIGEMILLNNKVKVYQSSRVLKTVAVKKVEVTLLNGAIARRGLRVELQDGTVFMNFSAPINLPKFNRRKSDNLYLNDSRRKNVSIQVGDVLDYHYFGRFHYPEDGYFTLTPEKLRDTLKAGSSLNSLIDVSVYTDLLGLLGRKANGVIQTEVAAHFLSNSGTVRNADITFHNFIRPYIRLSKLDSKFSSIDSSHIKANPGIKDSINRTYLNQVSYFQAGLLTNVIRFGIGVNQFVYLNIGADINLVNADSLYKKDVLFFNYYPEVQYSITRLKNFGMDCSIRFLRQRVGDNVPVDNGKGIWFFKPQVSIYYYPSKDQSKKVYVRFNYFDNLTNSQDNFSQFQFGYKTNLKWDKK